MRRIQGVVVGGVLAGLAGLAWAGPFTAGNLVVVNVGDGSAALTSAATGLTLREYDFSTSTLINPLGMPSGTSGVRLTLSGTSTSEGFLTLSNDLRYLTMMGYDASAGTTPVTSSTSAAINRVAGRVDMFQSTLLTPFNDVSSGSNPRSSVSLDGSQYWMTGGAGGLRYGTSGPTSTSVSTNITNLRVVNATATDLLYSTASGTAGIYSLGGQPTSGPITSTLLFATGAGSSPYDFWMANPTTVYVADDRSAASGGGVQKWVFSGTWSLAYTIATGVAGAGGARGLAGGVDGLGNFVLYATTTETNANRLVQITDLGAGSTFTLLATAGANTAFRGVDFAPVPSPGALMVLGLAGFAAWRRRR